MRARIEQELALLRRRYAGAEHAAVDGEDWFKLPCYPLPHGWRIGGSAVEAVPTAFLIKGDYPCTAPYGFLTRASLNFNGNAPTNAGAPPKQPPFLGDWMHFSWSVEIWLAVSDIYKGSNLLAWARSFAVRLNEGV